MQQKILLQQNFWQNSQSCLFHATNNLCKFFQAPFQRCVIFWQNNDSKSRFFHHFKEFCQNRFFFSNSSSSLKVRMPLFFKCLYIWSIKFLRVSVPLNLETHHISVELLKKKMVMIKVIKIKILHEISERVQWQQKNFVVTIDYCNKNFVVIEFCWNKIFLLLLKILYCNKIYCCYNLLQQNFCCDRLS